MAFGVLLVRIVFGSIMAIHGTQKLFGWFGGYGLAGTGQFFDGLGFRPGSLFAGAAGATEVASGILVALGLLGAVGPALMISVMIVAIVSAHLPNGLLAASNGVELPLLYAATAAGLGLIGPGAYSLDAWLGLQALSAAPLSWTLLAAGVVAGFANVALRRQVPVAA